MSRYQPLFDRLKERDELAFIPFVVLGDPEPALSMEIVRALVAGGADALELGFPVKVTRELNGMIHVSRRTERS